jgi:hypothetical protein
MSSSTLLERVRAVLFTDMKTNQVLGAPFVDSLERRSISGIEVVDFRWGRKGCKIKENKSRWYTCLDLPGPVIKSLWKRKSKRKKEDLEDYSWLKCLRLGPYSRGSDIIPEWKKNSGTYFAQSLIKVVETIGVSGRSVWFLVRPLQSPSVPKVPLISFSHWGILISPLTKRQMDDLICGDHSNNSEAWGNLHELNRQGDHAFYTRKRFYASDFERATKLDYLGQTEMTDRQLDQLGNSVSVNVANRCRY